MNSLDKVIEFVINAQKDRPVAVSLEVAALARQFFLRGKQPGSSVREIDDSLFANVIILAAVDIDNLRQGLFNGMPLSLEIMPENEMILRAGVYNLGQFPDPQRNASS